jgi:acetylornithine deacetylase/succinyl-diaminopimelate desuccinylase-like protein
MPNPAMRLASLLASMKDDSGRVTVKGYYDAIAAFTAEERAILDAVPDDTARMLATFGVAGPEKAFPKLQDALQYPTLNVRGMVSSFVGANARTIVPDRATAALDIRLVKETPAADLVAKLRAHIEQQGYHLVDADPDEATRAKYGKIARLAISETVLNPFRTPIADPRARALVTSLTRTFGEPPVQLRTLGGSVPIAPFIDALGFPAVLVPIVNFDNNQHEENENLRIGALLDGIVTIAAVLRM